MQWLAPTLALTGTLAATLAGLYEFMRRNKRRANLQYAQIRTKVLSELLDALHDLEVRSRDGAVTVKQLERQLRALNRKLIAEYSFGLDQQEQRWARDYIEGLIAIYVGLKEAPEGVYEWWASTAIEPIPIEISGAFNRVEKADKNLMKRLRAAMRGVDQ